MPSQSRTLPAESCSTVLFQLIEQLFGAHDEVAVAALGEQALSELGIGGCLRWETLPDPASAESAASAVPEGSMELARNLQHERRLVHVPATEESAAPLTERERQDLAWLRRVLEARLRELADTTGLHKALARVDLAERLQRALYAIAEQTDARRNLADMMSSLHNIVGKLMYAENFYVVMYEKSSDTLTFPYYRDTKDVAPPSPELHIPLREVEFSLTWNLLRSHRPLIGSLAQLQQQLGENLVVLGPRCQQWLGVPLLRDGAVIGGLVVQSYRDDVGYTADDCELLSFVAQHVQTALERRSARAELESRIVDRTAALREINQVLRQQMLQRQRGERLQAALFRIAELASTTESLDNFYVAIHRVISGLLYARNFYIALVDPDGEHLNFPYSVDEMEPTREPRRRALGATEYVLRHGKPLLANPEAFERLIKLGEIRQSGAPSVCWLGVPLSWSDRVTGALVVQSYKAEHTYTERDQELLTFVSYHIANALHRKNTAESLKQAYAGLERRVNERTRALALANRDLREQIAERERVERRLKYETLHDSLTGLPNRTLLLQRLEQALQSSQSEPSELFAVLFIDLDRFKVINDSVGHLVGDDLLFQVGGRIRACLKTRDLVARLGGDEFAVLIEDITDTAMAVVIAERIISELQVPFRLGIKEVFTSASIGIAMSAPHYRQPEELLRDADAAMYCAKDAGRHRAALFDDRLRHQALALLDMEGDLRRALAREEFVPFYQPIVAIEDGRIIGYEALLRWNNPDRGLLEPGDFLVVAEECGCAESIDWQIFEQVFAQAVALTRGEVFISINVSARHFRSHDLDQRLLEALARHGVPHPCIHVEVTERALLENPPEVKRMLENLRQQDVSISLDDFGTGYSSLSYLHQYPIKTLKIDRSFITQLSPQGEENQGLAVVRGIQVLADALQMQVIAEGIEFDHQREALMRIGTRYAQGFLFSRAKPASVWLDPDAPLQLPMLVPQPSA